MTDATPPGDEVDRLRAEVARLQGQLAGANGGESRRAGRWRPPVVGVLILLGSLLAPLAVLATWADDLAGDTESYVETVQPLAADPAIQAAITNRVTDALFERLDVEAVAQEAVDALAARGLPESAAFALNALAGPLADGVRGFVEEHVHRLISSTEFQEAWVQANREAHQELVAVLTGRGGSTVALDDNAVTINLAAVIEVVKERLADAGFALVDRIPAVQAEFTLLESSDLTRLQSGFRLLSAVSTILPILALACFGAAIALAASHRRALVGAALGLAAGMLLLGIALNTFRLAYLDALPPDVSVAAAAAVYDNLAYFIRLSLRGVLVFALLVAAVAWITGPGPAPTTLRQGAGRALDATRSGSDRAGIRTGRLGELAWTYRTPVRVVVLGGAVVLYVLADQPTGAWTLTLAGVAAAILVLVELVARQPAGPPQASDPTTSP